MPFHRPVPILFVLLFVAGLAGCGGGADEAGETTPSPAAADPSPAAADPSTQAPEDASSPAAPAVGGPATLATVETDGYGRMLVDDDDLTLYVFLADTDGTSTCYDTCEDNWPPVLTDGDAVVEGRADDALLGTAKRNDGTAQVTYADQPLYRYSGDSAPGDVLGYGSGDVWYPVAPDGSAIDTADDRSADDGY